MATPKLVQPAPIARTRKPRDPNAPPRARRAAKSSPAESMRQIYLDAKAEIEETQAKIKEMQASLAPKQTMVTQLKGACTAMGFDPDKPIPATK